MKKEMLKEATRMSLKWSMEMVLMRRPTMPFSTSSPIVKRTQKLLASTVVAAANGLGLKKDCLEGDCAAQEPNLSDSIIGKMPSCFSCSHGGGRKQQTAMERDWYRFGLANVIQRAYNRSELHRPVYMRGSNYVQQLTLQLRAIIHMCR